MHALKLINYQLSLKQLYDLEKKYHIYQIYNLTKYEETIWKNIPTDINRKKLKKYLFPIIKTCYKYNIVIINNNNELSACSIIIDECHNNKIKVLTPITKKISEEITYPNKKIIKKSIYKYIRFREC